MKTSPPLPTPRPPVKPRQSVPWSSISIILSSISIMLNVALLIGFIVLWIRFTPVPPPPPTGVPQTPSVVATLETLPGEESTLTSTLSSSSTAPPTSTETATFMPTERPAIDGYCISNNVAIRNGPSGNAEAIPHSTAGTICASFDISVKVEPDACSSGIWYRILQSDNEELIGGWACSNLLTPTGSPNGTPPMITLTSSLTPSLTPTVTSTATLTPSLTSSPTFTPTP
jgi:hypothetical protein